MANRYQQQTLNSFVKNLTYICGQFSVGSSGAVSLVKGTGIVSVTRLYTGVYLIKFTDAYYRFLNSHFRLREPAAGSSVADGSFVANTAYEITAVGTTDWAGAGLTAGIVAAVGTPFVATGIGGSGTGTAKAATPGLVGGFEVVGDPNVQINQKAYPSLIFRCLGPTSSSVTTQISVDPASGSMLYFEFLLRNSGLKNQGE